MNLDKLFKKLNKSFSVSLENENSLSLTEMLDNLLKLSNLDWGYYEFARDLIGYKFADIEKTNLISECDKLVEQLYYKYAKSEFITPQEIAINMELKINRPDLPNYTSQIIFGEFVEPNEIYVYQNPVNKFREWTLSNKDELQLFQNIDLDQVIIAHELFHYIEKLHQNTILTKTYRKELWRLGPFYNSSQVGALSEYSAKIFSQRLTNSRESVYLLEIMLIYFYDPASANKVYQQILNSIENVKNEKK